MRLAPEEAAILAGARGEAVRDALAYQLEVGEFFGAERFVPITNAHMMGDIEVMGDGGLGWLRGECAKRARACVPTTTNARCFDFEHAARLGQDPARWRRSASSSRRCAEWTSSPPTPASTTRRSTSRTSASTSPGATPAPSSTPTRYSARASNFESGPAALAAAITGRTPEYGFHLDRHRKGTLVVRLETPLEDLADWGAVGKIVGEKHQNYYAVPVFTGVGRPPTRRRAEAPRRGARELRLDGHVPHGRRHAGGADPRSGARRQSARSTRSSSTPRRSSAFTPATT